MVKITTTILLFLALWPAAMQAATSTPDAARLPANILKLKGLNDFWFINPADQKRYYLSNGDDYRKFLERVPFSIPSSDLQAIGWPVVKSVTKPEIAKRYAGQVVYEGVNKQSLWYVDPVKLERVSLEVGGFSTLKKMATATTNEKLRSIERGAKTRVIDNYSRYERKKVKTPTGEFLADIVTIDLSNPNLKIMTDTADNHSCKKNCRARTLHSFIETNQAFAGMNGTYFDTSRAKLNYYFFPVYNSNTKKFINEDQLKYPTTGPIMAFDMNNKFYYFKDSREFKSVAAFEKKYGVKLQAAIGNKPRLIEEGWNYLIDWEVDHKQLTVKTLRNAIAYKDGKLYLVVTQKSTVPDLADVLTALGMQYALNMDGGYSTALFYDGKMAIGPGRDIPNIIAFGYKNPQLTASTTAKK